MKNNIAKNASNVLTKIANYFVFTASPFVAHRPEVPQELKNN